MDILAEVETSQGVEEIDPGTFNVIMGIYENIGQEMMITLERSAWTSIINLCRDFSVGIADDACNLVSVPDTALPIQAMTMQRIMKSTADFFEGEIYDGDVLMCNLAYLGNTHMGEPLIASPVFHNGEMMFWSMARGHLADMGTPAYVPSYPYSKDLYSEGLKIPPIKLFEKGKLRKDVLELYLGNLRARSNSHGDLMAHVACTWRGKEQLLGLVERYGPETVRRYTQELLDYTSRRVAAEIRRMKPGTYYGEDWMDSNGYGTKNIPVRAKLTVEDDMWTVDLSECPPQMIGTLNSSLHGSTESAIVGTLAFCVDPSIPKNEGFHRHVKIICPEGTICSATTPFSTQHSTCCAGELIYRALLRAAAGAVPDMVAAGSTVIQWSTYIGVTERADRNKLWAHCNFNECGGGGAADGTDGHPCMMEMGVAGAMTFMSTEMEEWLYPVLVKQCEIYTDSQGAGQWRGGPGVITHITGHGSSTMDIYTCCWGHENLSHGTVGGGPGIGGTVYVFDPADPEKRHFYSGIGKFQLPKGWEYVVIASGGGGYGDPLDRNPDMVAADVRDCIVSLEAARSDYGVIFETESHVVELAATRKLRAGMKQSRGPAPLNSPTEPATSTLRRRLMTEHDSFTDLDRDPTEDSSPDLWEQ
jgi:N-methylhydantoinase B